MPINLTLLTKPGCHLCDDALVAVEATVAEFQAATSTALVSLEIKNILDDAELQKRYAEEIPVLLINNRVHNYWRIDRERLRAALDDAEPEA